MFFRVRNLVRISESILAKILLNNVTRIQVDSRKICYFAYKLNEGESKDSCKLKSIVLKGGQVPFGSFQEKWQNRILFIIAGNGLQ